MSLRVLLFSLPPSGGDFFPVSQGYIAASLKAAGFECAVSEIERITSRTGQSIANFVIAFRPAVVGFTVYQANIRLALKLAQFVKQIDRRILVVFGGPQVTFMPAQALASMPAVDVLCRGEGETVMPQLAAALANNLPLSEVRGIAVRSRQGGKRRIVATADSVQPVDLDVFPSPYQSGCFDFGRHSIACMLTSRGCTFKCAFCYTPQAYHRRIRYHSVRRVLEDMRVCVRHGIRRFYFADPSFTVDKGRAERIMAGIIRNRWKVEIWCETRADLIDRPLLRLMAKAGVRYVAYGLETVDPAVQKLIRKPVDLRQFEQAVRWTQEQGIKPEVFFLYGLPGQTYASCVRTVDFLKKLGIELRGNSAGQQLNLFFGTQIQQDPAAFGMRVRTGRLPAYLSAGTRVSNGAMSRTQIQKLSCQNHGKIIQ